jgi:hypothetical protein
MKKKQVRKIKTGNEVVESLGKIINNTYENYGDKLIFKIENNYLVFNQYAIQQNDNNYRVVRRRDDFELTFNSKKLALLWSILDLNRHLYEANRVKMLDGLLISVEIEKTIHNRLLKSNIVVYSNKIQQDILRNKKYNIEINKYIRLVNKLQKRNFENEIN